MIMQQKTIRYFMGRRFLLFLISQNLISCCAIIQVVTVARLIVDMTNSGLLTGFSIVCAPLPGVLMSLFAGCIGDRFQAKKLMICFDIMRGCLFLLFIFCKTELYVFSVMILISVFDILYSPSKNKVLTSVIGGESILKGNSLLSGGSGAVNMVTPVLIGLLIASFGVKTAFIIGSAMYFLSSALLSGINVKSHKVDTVGQDRLFDVSEGIRYCLYRAPLKRAILTSAFADFGTICVNIVFYSLAFDVLNVSSGYWGLLLSVLYGMNLFSMIILMKGRKQFAKNPLIISQLLLMGVSFVWLFYSVTRNQIFLLIGVAAEGLCISMCNTLLMTCILETARKEYTARVVGIKDLTSNAAKLAGIGFTFLLMKFFGIGVVFASCSAIVFIYASIQTLLMSQTEIAGKQRREP